MTSEETPETDISILDYLNVIVRRRWMIIGIVVIGCLCAIAVSFLLPIMYTARTTLLPPEQPSQNSSLGALLANADLPIMDLGIAKISNNSELFARILKSRSVLEPIVSQFDLSTVYQVKNRENALKRLGEYLMIKTDKVGVISIDVEAPSAELAANMANAIVDELDRFNKNKNMTAAKTTRIFIEHRLEEAKPDLSKALVALKTFQEQHQIISLPDQARATVEMGAELASRLRFFEFELNVKRKTLSLTHPEVNKIQVQIEALRQQLNNLTFGDISVAELKKRKSTPQMTGINIPFTQFPALQLQLSQLMMDAKIQQNIVEIHLQQYEHAKIQEIHDTPTVRRLDRAIPPSIRSSPRRILIIILTGLSFGFMGIILAFILNYVQQITRDQGEFQKANHMLSLLRDDYIGLKRFMHRK